MAQPHQVPPIGDSQEGLVAQEDLLLANW